MIVGEMAEEQLVPLLSQCAASWALQRDRAESKVTLCSFSSQSEMCKGLMSPQPPLPGPGAGALASRSCCVLRNTANSSE